MVVCKYFMQGNCRFGDNCRFEHPRQGFGARQQLNFGEQRNTYKDPFGKQQSGGGKNAAMMKDPSPQELVDVISQDMLTWETSHMWPFSCYTYGKEGACFPGFDDLSVEELRWEAYQMQKADTLSLYVQKITQLANDYNKKRDELKKPSMTVKQKLFQEIQNQKTKSSSHSTTGNSFSNSSAFASNNGFGQSQGTSSVFGAVSSSPFGSSQPQSGTSPFSNNQQTGALQAGLFGKSTSGSAFGNSQNSSVFGGNTTAFGSSSSSSSTGLFGKPAVDATQSAFGLGSSNTTNTPTTPGLFGKPAAQTNNSAFGVGITSTPNNTGLFGKPGPGQSVFGATQSSTTAPAATGLFGKPAIFGGAQPGTTSVFGNTSSNNAFNATSSGTTNIIGQQQINQQSTQNKTVSTGVYTPLDQLTKEELEQFQADRFTLGKIPTRPPPRELV